MAVSLVPCGGCARHVRASESACPFCHAALDTRPDASPPPSNPGRLNRAALFALGATLNLAACGTSTPPPADAPAETAPDDGGTMALYGGPAPVDSGMEGDDGGTMALYGGPAPVDSGNG